jgi:hypothetical protein
MGLRLDWIAVRGGDEKRLLDQFELRPYGHVSQEFAAPFAFGKVGDWLVLTAERSEICDDDVIAEIAQSYGDVLGASIVENVGYSRVQAYADGVKSWDVAFDVETDGDGLAVDGHPPNALEVIAARCAAEQADDPEVMHFFDAPIELAKTVCGYEAGQIDNIDWRALVKTSAKDHLPEGTRGMPEAIREELLPLLKQTDWRMGPKQLMAGPDCITREVGPCTQSIWFWFVGGEDNLIQVHFWELDTKLRSKADYIVGRSLREGDRRPFWKRALGLDKPAAPADPVAAAIAGAKDDILRIETYLKTRVEDERLSVRKARGRP